MSLSCVWWKNTFLINFKRFSLFSTMQMHARACVRWLKYITDYFGHISGTIFLLALQKVLLPLHHCIKAFSILFLVCAWSLAAWLAGWMRGFREPFRCPLFARFPTNAKIGDKNTLINSLQTSLAGAVLSNTSKLCLTIKWPTLKTHFKEKVSNVCHSESIMHSWRENKYSLVG